MAAPTLTAPKRQSLSLDLEELFPGEPITFGNTTIIICPLSLVQIATLSKKFTGLFSILSKQGITWENYSTPKNLFSIAAVILENFPDLLEETANVEIEDLRRLPIEPIVQIIDKIIFVNLKSKDDLLKNFKSLIEKFTPPKEKTKMTGKKIKRK